MLPKEVLVDAVILRCVVVQGKCQGLVFSDFVSQIAFPLYLWFLGLLALDLLRREM